MVETESLPSAANMTQVALAPGTLEANSVRAQTSEQLGSKISELIADQQGDQNARIVKHDMGKQ